MESLLFYSLQDSFCLIMLFMFTHHERQQLLPSISTSVLLWENGLPVHVFPVLVLEKRDSSTSRSSLESLITISNDKEVKYMEHQEVFGQMVKIQKSRMTKIILQFQMVSQLNLVFVSSVWLQLLLPKLIMKLYPKNWDSEPVSFPLGIAFGLPLDRVIRKKWINSFLPFRLLSTFYKDICFYRLRLHPLDFDLW